MQIILTRLSLAVTLLLVFHSNSTASDILSLELPFYSEHVTVRYHANMKLNVKIRTEERSMVQYFRNLESTDYRILLEDLQHHQQALKLNDYLLYDLMKDTVEEIYRGQSKLQKTLTCWFLLSKAGFDTRLTYLNQKAFLYVHTKDELFEVPMIQERNRTFVNLSSVHANERQKEALYMLNFVANPSGRPFTFYLDQLPQFRPQLATQNLHFKNGNIDHQLEIQTDKTIADLMKKYPFFAEEKYLEAPLSPTLTASLLPQLREKIAPLDDYKAVQLIASFTRSAFKYKEDKYHFGKSKPMIPDELFHYPYSDCEDRAALFYSLVKTLLDLPMIAIAYPDHLTVAVHFKAMKNAKHAITHQGKKYYICDPTGPSNSNTIAQAPEGYERKRFKIIGNHVGR